MLSPLALPCLPNNEVVYTRMSSASVFIEAKDVLVYTIIIIMVVVILIIITVIIQFDPTRFFCSVHGCKGS